MPTQRKYRQTVSRIAVRPMPRYSNGAITINKLLGSASKLVRRDPLPRQYHTVINWGNSSVIRSNNPDPNIRIINKPSAVAEASNKKASLMRMHMNGVRVPLTQTNPPDIQDGEIWLARTVLNGSGGQGIKVIRYGDTVPEAPLYTKYVRKTVEWRIHVAFGKAIFAQRKLRVNDADQTKDQKLIRNHDNGWVFGPRPIEEAGEEAVEQAIKAVSSLGLDFGAVDLVIGKRDGLPYVLEVNTAPGIESPTLEGAYEAAFKQALLQ